MDFDVVIVGLGPVGAVAANLAGQQGLKVLAVDKSMQIYDKPRAFGLDHEVMRVFGNIGIADEIAEYVMPYRTSEYHTSGGRVLKRIVAASAPYPLGWEANYVFSQPAVEAVLRKKAASLPNVHIELGTTVIGTTRVDGGHCLRLRTEAGEERDVTANYVLACDGGSSTMRAQLGLEMENLEFDEPWVVVDVMVNADALERLPETNIQYCEVERPSTYIVGPGRHRRWEFMINPGEVPEDLAQPRSVETLLSRWLAPDDYVFWRAAAYRFHALVLQCWRKDNLFFLGDAAHMTPPFMAQGMCQGIRDAANLIWKLVLVLRGQASDELLDSYEKERIPHVRQTTLVTKDLGRIICERDPERASRRDEKMLAEMAESSGPTVRQTLIPGLSCGFIAAPEICARGELFPQPRVRDYRGKSGLLDDFTGMAFRLVVMGAGNGPDDAALSHAFSLWERLTDIPLIVVRLIEECEGHPRHESEYTEQEGVVKQWMVARACKVAVVRPDHYVYGACSNLAQAGELLCELLQKLKRAS